MNRIVLSMFLSVSLAGSALSAGGPEEIPATVDWPGVMDRMPQRVYWPAAAEAGGRVYVFGGVSQNALGADVATSYTQIYDPAADSWSLGTSMPTPRYLHAAAVVDGLIHVTAGRDLSGALNEHEVYDPSTDQWTTAANVPVWTRGHSTACASGRLYLFGGTTGAYQKKVRIYDPGTDQWSLGADMPGASAYGGAAWLPGLGRILYAAGQDGGSGADKYVGRSWTYDPAADAWDAGFSTMLKAVRAFTLAADPDAGKVYVFSGDTWDGVDMDIVHDRNQVYDASTGQWGIAPSLPSPAGRAGGASAKVGSRIVFAGGITDYCLSGLTESFDPAAGAWDAPYPPSSGAYQNPVVEAVNGVVYAIGGTDGVPRGSVCAYDASVGTWSIRSAVDPVPRFGAASGVWNGTIIVTGGADTTPTVDGSTVSYDPAADAFFVLSPDPVPRAFPAAAVLDDALYVFGGYDDEGYLASASALDLNAGTWTACSDMPVAAYGMAAAAVDGRICLAGGFDGSTDDQLYGRVLVYDPVQDLYSVGASLPLPVACGAAVSGGDFLAVDSGMTYVKIGGDFYSGTAAVIQFYDPGVDSWVSRERPWSRPNHGAAMVDGRLYAASGGYGERVFTRLDVADVGVPACSVSCSASADPDAGEAPLTVSFEASAQLNGCQGAASYAWQFGDGDTSFQEDPVHVYEDPGTYPWTLQVEADGEMCNASGTVSVTDPPCTLTCTADASPAAGQVPLTVHFTATASAQNCSGTPAYSWTFGDGGSSQDPNPEHTYAAAGTYTWSLLVLVDGETCSETGQIVVTDNPVCTITCSAGADPSMGDAPLAVDFLSQVQTENCAGEPSYLWTFGDGGTSSESQPTHTYPMAGTYSWVLTVSADDETCQDGGTVTVTEPCALDCSASVVPGYGGDPLAVAFEGAAIASNCGEQPSFSWAFGDGAGSQAQSPVHEYAAPGSYDWTLTVTADEADCTRSGTVTVTGPCDPQCAAEAVPDAGGAPLEVTFTAVVDTAGCTEAPAYAWSFGDGQASDQADPVHVYADPGLYAWTLTVEADGLTCSAEGAVEVLEPLKPGDCDGGGTITIGEVQGAVNMFLGTAAPACGVDCNGDGTVSIGEVQKVINGFLGFPATC